MSGPSEPKALTHWDYAVVLVVMALAILLTVLGFLVVTDWLLA